MAVIKLNNYEKEQIFQMANRILSFLHITSFFDFMSNTVQQTLFLEPVVDEEIKKIVSNFMVIIVSVPI